MPVIHRKASARGDAIEFVQQLLSPESGSGATASVGWYQYTFVVGWTVGATVAVAVAVAVGVGVPVGVGVAEAVGVRVAVAAGVGVDVDPPLPIPPAKMTTTTAMAATITPATATKTKGFVSLLIGPIIACLAPLSSDYSTSAGEGETGGGVDRVEDVGGPEVLRRGGSRWRVPGGIRWANTLRPIL